MILKPGCTVSHHFLRRTARDRARHLERLNPGVNFTVRSYVRGPFGWRVIVLTVKGTR